ncbi:hypothetical protein TWF730_007032 [Orbilia blumenaviensis]|uniref:Uncharacterized protein n=1 Tax=Orbilia blumenaviensis TaxID=1796055 RepID=A0AAV9VHH1_9PEZI
MISSKLLPVFLLATTALAVDLHAPQSHSLKRYTLAKRQGSGSIGIGSSCSAITGNPADVICEISGDNVSCAPVCCMRNGEFVDGCPAGDQCVFEGSALKCCPAGRTCGPRPTACANFGSNPTGGVAVCPSATPTCTTRNDGGIACTGQGLAVTSEPTPTGRLIRPNAPNPTQARPTEAPAVTDVTSSADDSTETEVGDIDDAEPTGMPTISLSGGTINLPDSATPTDEDSPAASTSASSSAASIMEKIPVCGIIVTTVLALGIFL